MASHQVVLLLFLLCVTNSSSNDHCRELSYSSYFLQDISSSGDVRIRPQISQYLSGNDGPIDAKLFTCCSPETDDSRNTYFTMQFYECPDGGDLYYTLQSWYSPCPPYNATCYPYFFKRVSSNIPQTMDIEGHPSNENDERMFRYTMTDNVVGSIQHQQSSNYLQPTWGNSMQYTSNANTLWGFLPELNYLGTWLSPFQAANAGCGRRKRTAERGSSSPRRAEGGSSNPRRAEGGSSSPGRAGGGSSSPGRTGGGNTTPGRTGGGSSTSGRAEGRSSSPGRTGGVSRTPGRAEGRSSSPGRTGGVSRTPGRAEGRSSSPGRTGGGSSTSGRTGGGSSTPGRAEGRSSSPGRTGVGSSTPGRTGRGSSTPGRPEGGSSSPGRGVDQSFRGRGPFTGQCFQFGYEIGLSRRGDLSVIRRGNREGNPAFRTAIQFEFLLYTMHSPPIISSCAFYCPKRLSLFEAVIIRLKNTAKYIDGEETESRTGVIMKTRQENVRVNGRSVSIDYAGIVLRSYEELIPRPQNGGSTGQQSATFSLRGNISMAGIHPHFQQHADQRFYRVHRRGIRARLESVLSPGSYLAILETANEAKLVLTKLRFGTSSSLKFDFKVPFDNRFYRTRPILLPRRRCDSFYCHLGSLPGRSGGQY